MAMTNTERQRRYREKRKVKAVDEKRLSMFISFDAHSAMHRIAMHHGITAKEALERLLLTTDKAISNSLDVHKPEFDEYYERPLRRNNPDHFRLEHDRVVWTCNKCGHVIGAKTEGELVRLRDKHRTDNCLLPD